MIIKWTRCYFPKENGTITITEPEMSGNYFVTDGYIVHLAHYHNENAIGDRWGIYLVNKQGIIEHCYRLDDMNFRIKAYSELLYPDVPEELQEI